MNEIAEKIAKMETLLNKLVKITAISDTDFDESEKQQPENDERQQNQQKKREPHRRAHQAKSTQQQKSR